MNAIDEPDRDLERHAQAQGGAAPPADRSPNAAAIVGIARKNENSAAAARSRPSSIAADDRGAGPRDARNQRQRLTRARRPTPEPTGIASTLVTHRRVGRNALDEQHDDAAERRTPRAITPKLCIEHALHELRTATAPATQRRNGRDDDRQRKMPRLGLRRQTAP